MALVVHHLNESRSQRVLFLLEELGVPYEIRRYARDPKTMLAPPELKAVHPLGKSPVVTDGDVTLAETGLIVDYLIQHHGGDGILRPPADAPERLRYAYYLHYAEGSLMPLVLLSLLFGRMPRQAPLPLRPLAGLIAKGVMGGYVTPQTRLHLGILDAELATRAWFAGETLTGADAIMSFPIQALKARGALGAHVNLCNWLERLEARPAWTRATEKGGRLTFKFG